MDDRPWTAAGLTVYRRWSTVW